MVVEEAVLAANSLQKQRNSGGDLLGRRFGLPRQILARRKHVVQRSEREASRPLTARTQRC
jgi:hypothetical protein